ncbi:Altered inheritance of mitochondria protein 6 [Rhinocladiella similis]
MPQPSPAGCRVFRGTQHETLHHEPSTEAERVPFLTQDQPFIAGSDLENGASLDPSAVRSDTDKSPIITVSSFPASDTTDDDHISSPVPSRWRWKERIPLLSAWVGRGYLSRHKKRPSEKPLSRHPLRRVLRLLAYSLMLLGLLEFIALACGVFFSFFPSDVSDEHGRLKSSGDVSPELGRWPTDFSADVHAVACHSHNDYWRKEPLFSALRAGCTGVEADVWLYDEELYVGHTTASLTPQRTLRSLYIDPLVKILDQQNPTTSFHPSLDSRRGGVFDTDPAQTLVLLIDFKNDGNAIWPYVSEQLAPLRQKGYLTHFNGTKTIEGPVTVVVTGNAPYLNVVASPHYRDMFFDAPLDVLETLDPGTPAIEHPRVTAEDLHASTKRSVPNKGQGRSGAAPVNAAVYAPTNSYYASVNFKRSIGYPWRGKLSSGQIEKIRKQIAGAHNRGLKVRYWGVPNWPRGMRNYMWRVLYQEGVDYLNVDDLRAATQGTWNWDKKSSWFSGPWRFWSS